MEGKITAELLSRYAQGLCTAEEKKWVENWLENSDDLFNGNINLDSTDILSLEKELWNGFSAKRKKAENRNRQIKRWLFQAAAASVIGLSLFAGYYYSKQENQGWSAAVNKQIPEISFTAPSGKASTIILPDQSSVVLAAGSTVHYPSSYSDSTRTITFEQGEAFFDIKHDTNKPFLVKIGGAEVRVFGTKFNIKNEKGTSKMTVTLAEGSIGFSEGKNKLCVLKPGQQLSYNKETAHIIGMEKVDARYVIAWTTDLLWFRETPFVEVLRRTELHYGVHFVVQGNVDLQSPLNGKFDNKPLPYVLRLLENSTGYKFLQKGNVVYISD